MEFGISSAGSWCKSIIPPPTRDILVGFAIYGSSNQDITRGAVGLLIKHILIIICKYYFVRIQTYQNISFIIFKSTLVQKSLSSVQLKLLSLALKISALVLEPCFLPNISSILSRTVFLLSFMLMSGALYFFN